ncbi:winged helix DNA-binding domain-containing protein [Cryobacterium sp. BB736]|uniref:winged helix DNA-binding domain-containing protein n=1 Tax=Cryobacterium sp. BB736 TaxID=2746963 RepID=UPI001876FA89|nr:winged helix DNA-binding domain-containing protein [Cryobacterium sp. BB736]
MARGPELVAARRLARHLLEEPHAPDAAAAASASVGTHAQIASSAEVSIGIRMAAGGAADVREALWPHRTLTKTYGPRGTVHYLATDELGMWLPALDAVPVTGGGPDDVRLDGDQTTAVVEAVRDALAQPGIEDGLTLDELDKEVVARTGSWAGELVMPAFQTWWPRWRQVISRAAARGALAFGPGRGRTITYVRAPDYVRVEEPEVQLLQRYLHAYGPAAPRDFARWLSAPIAWADSVFERASVERIADVFVNAGDTGFPDAASSAVLLLPYFDAFVVGSHPRSELFPRRAYERALARGQAGNYPVLVVDGTVQGVWHQKKSGKRIAITVEAFSRLSAGQRREVEHRAERIGAIQGASVSVSFGEVSVGPHA